MNVLCGGSVPSATLAKLKPYSLMLLLGLLTSILPLSFSVPTLADASIQDKKTDFNGDGYADLAVGVTRENVGIVFGAGSVNVIYGSASGLSTANNREWTQSSPDVEGNLEQQDRFGTALSTGDFNNDGYTDLAVGAFHEWIGDTIDAGAVNVLYGSSAGISPTVAADGTGMSDQFWSQDSPDVEDAAEMDDLFGSKLATGDFNSDGYADLVIGVPFESFEGQTAAGAVNVVYGSSEGLSAIALSDGSGIEDQLWTRNSQDIEGIVGGQDQFASSLAVGDFNLDGYQDLAIGSEIDGSGSVNVIYGSPAGLSATFVPNQLWTQNSVDIEGSAEGYDSFGSSLATGDFNNDRFVDLAVGVPNEDDSGAVNVIYGSPSGLSAVFVPDQLWMQNSLNVNGHSELLDWFGFSLATGDFDDDGYFDLAVGAPREDLGLVEDAGAVNVLYGSSVGLSATTAGDGTGRIDQLWHQDNLNVEEDGEPFDYFGFSLTAGDFNGDGSDDLAIGVPYEDVRLVMDAGGVTVLYGSDTYGLNWSAGAFMQFWAQNTNGINGRKEALDGFGFVVA